MIGADEPEIASVVAELRSNEVEVRSIESGEAEKDGEAEQQRGKPR